MQRRPPNVTAGGAAATRLVRGRHSMDTVANPSTPPSTPAAARLGGRSPNRDDARADRAGRRRRPRPRRQLHPAPAGPLRGHIRWLTAVPPAHARETGNAPAPPDRHSAVHEAASTKYCDAPDRLAHGHDHRHDLRLVRPVDASAACSHWRVTPPPRPLAGERGLPGGARVASQKQTSPAHARAM
jgi:hypothetical protein